MALSEAEELELLELEEQEALAEVPEEPKPGMVQQIKDTFTQGFDVPPVVQKGAQILDAGARAGKAVGVGLQNAFEGSGLGMQNLLPGNPMNQQQSIAVGQNAPAALVRTKAAFKPDFVPANDKEAMAGELGETLAVSLEMLPIIAAGEGHPALASGLTMGGLEAIKQASREGRIVPLEVGEQAALGAALPLIVPTTKTLVNTTRNVLKSFLSKTAKVPEQAIDTILDNPRLLQEFSGTSDDIRAGVVELQKAVVESRKRVGNILGKVKKELGVANDLSTPIVDAPMRTPAQADDAFRTFQETIMPSEIDPSQKLKEAVAVRHQIKELLTPPKPGTNVPPISSMVEAQLMDRLTKLNEIITKLPGGSRLRAAEDGFAKTAQLYDELQRTLATEGKAEEFLMKLFKGEDLDDVLGSKATTMKALRKIEKQHGKPLVDPIIKHLSARALKTFESKGLTGNVLTGVAAVLAMIKQPAFAAMAAVASSPKGVASTLPLIDKGLKGAEMLGKAAGSPLGQSLIGGSFLSDRQEPVK